MHVSDAYVREFRGRNYVKGGECKTREKFQISQQWQNRNFGKNLKFIL